MGKTLGYGEITVANVTEPFTVMLTNEAQQFATDSNRKVTSAQSYYTDIIVIRGSQERTDYTIGNITSGSGITVSKSSKRVTFSVSAGTTIGADTGVIEIPITLDGQTVKKQFSWSCGKQGPQGVQGNDGNSFAWNMLSETNCGKKHWGTESSGGKYSVEDFITEDNINAVKLICTEGISTSNWSYVLFKDIKMLKQLKPSTKYTLSYDIKANRSGAISHSICKGDVSNFCTNTVVVNNIIGNETWQHISVVLTTNDLKTTPTNEILYLGRNALSKVGYSIIKNLKLVEGDIDTPWSPSQSDIEGKGIAQTVQYYLATSQASGVTSSTSGWSTDITTQKITATKKYLWNCSQTRYTDGTSEPITIPTIIGAYGDKGETGADGQDGAGFHWNLLKYSGDLSQMFYGKVGGYIDTQEFISDASTPSKNVLKSTITTVGNGIYIQGKYLKKEAIKKGNTYTVSAWCKCSSAKDIGVMNVEFLDKKVNISMPKLSTEWQQYIITGVANKDVTTTSGGSAISFYYGNKMAVGDIFYISSPKVEEGDKASPWCTTYEETLAKNLSTTPSAQIFKSTDGGNTFAPNQITITPTLQGDITFGKWQYSIDGGVSFADVVSGQKGLTISNNVLSVSKDSSLYSDAVTMVIFRAVANDSSFYDTCSIAKIYDVSELEIGGVNLFVKSTVSRGYWLSDTGVLNANGGWGYSDYIDVSRMKNYIASGFTNLGISPATCFYDSNKTFISGVQSTNQNSQDSKRKTLPIPSNAKYMRFSFMLVDIDTLKIEQGTKATAYSPSHEDVQTAILSTKSEISDVSLKVDKNKQAIEQRVEKTTYQQDLNLVKGDISKANEGLNKWRYEIYPKSLFASEYQGKSTMDVFAKNTNLTPSQSVLINDTDFGKSLAYGDNYIGYALTFVKFSAAKSIAITFKHDDGAHLYLNGKLIGGDDTCNTGSGESLTLSFIQGWNCLEVVLNEKSGGEYIGLGTTISAISECQLMNCYYGTPVARQSHITNQLVQNTTDIEGVTTTMQKVMTTVGGSDRIDEFVNNYNKTIESEKQFKKTIGETYTTKDEFNGLEIGGRNLVLDSKPQKQGSSYAVVSRRLSVDLQAGVTYTISFCGRVVDGDGSLVVYLYRNDWKDSIQKSTKSKENTVVSWQFTPKISGAFQIEAYSFLSQGVAGGNVYLDWFKVEKGNKATDWTPAPEDNEINGQNLVSNLPSNWEQGTFDDARTNVGCDYDTNKGSVTNRICVKELVPVSGTITISNAYSNQSKKPIQHWITAFDVNKKWLGSSYVNAAWSDFPRIVDMKDAKYIAVIVKYKDESAITPSDISQICLKIERGTSATPFTLAPEDVNGKIVNVETIANQTAKKFEWIVKGGDSSSNFTLTDRVADLVAERINFNGLVKFSGLNTDAKNEIGKVAQSKVDGLEVGGRNLLKHSSMIGEKLVCDNYVGCNNCDTKEYTNEGFHIITPTKGNANNGIAFSFDNFTILGINGGDTITFSCDIKGTSDSHAPFVSIHISDNDWYGSDVIQKNTSVSISSSWQRVSVTLTTPTGLSKNHMWLAIHGNYQSDLYVRNFKLEKGNKATDWMPAPEDVSQDASNKANQALTDAKNYSSNAVNWVTNNGSSTTSLNSMVKKWTDGAVSDTTQINGGWIKANTITASKIAIGDFTNYCQLNKDTASSYGFTATDDIKGVWFTASPIDRDKDISQWFTCEGGQKLYVEYDLSTTVKGKLKASDTDISYLTSGIMIFVTNGTKEIISYTRSKGVTATSDGAITHISLVETLPADARFFKVVLQTDGQRNTFSGTLKIRNPQVRKATTGKLIVDGSITADKIATDAIKSRNYISSGGTQGSFLNLSDGSFTSPNLSWDSNGNLIAKNANLSGEITATNGSIAGWTIISNKMYTTGSGKYTGIGKYGSAYAFWAGATSNDNGNSAVFKVGHTGKLTATDADITGTITATNGKIGRYDITSTYLMTNSGSNASGIGGNQAFWAGAEDSNSAPFRVGYDGVLWAENAAIRGSIETGNLGDEGDTVSIINGHIGIQGTSNNVEIYSTGFKFGIDGDYYLMSVSEGVKCYRNLYATDFVADGWLYCSEVHSSGAVVIGADSESFYWAHGYQIARGTSWGGVCVGDDSQQLRLYGSSIWASHSISTSDENLKENFTTLDQYENFYMNLNPIGFNYIGDYDGKKTHFGFGAHKTEDVLESEGYDADKFAVVTHRPLVQEDIEKRFGKDVEVDIETEYGVSYTEFIALNTHMIQKTRRELTKVKQEKADLEVRLQAIEAKLGL